MSYQISSVLVDGFNMPMGLDDPNPLFSWKFESAEAMKQTKARIMVGLHPEGAEFWDSGERITDRSIGIRYEGLPLQGETQYYVTLLTWNQAGTCCKKTSKFETGIMNPHIDAWEGAQWIGAPEYAVCADAMSVFTIESRFKILEGNRAGIVFGANDPRLLNRNRNESLLEGENYIRYVLNLDSSPASIEIYRVGYAPEDREAEPFAVFPAVDAENGSEVITEEKKDLPHTLKVVVTGNCAFTWLDGILVDRIERSWYFGTISAGRQLNPLGSQDITTFPHLCSIGCYAGAGTKVHFDGLRVFHNRKPHAKIVDWKSEGLVLSGESQVLHDPSCHALPMLRREFSVKNGLKRARLYATARGIYECRINGGRVDDAYFAPGASQFDKHLLYQTYDVTEQLHEGENAMGCILASGWWSDAQTYTLENYNFWGDRMSFLSKLVLEYADGSRETVVSSPENWQYYGEGPYRYAGFFHGETFDARKGYLLRAFFMPGFAAGGCKQPEVICPVAIETNYPDAPIPWATVNETEPELIGHFQAPVLQTEILMAKGMSEPAPGVFIYDLGQEIAGVPRLLLHGKEGQKITIRYGEMLYPALEEYGELAGRMLQANLREASNTDEYICCGEGAEVYSPRFTFHGFRYIEITGVEQAPKLEDVQGILLSSVTKLTGKFTCSNELVNKLVSNVGYSQRCNFISIPTDCPQRNERMGWVGDTHVFCRTATYQSDVKNFYIRNLQAMQDLQRADGRLPDIAPVGGGFGGITYESAMVLMVWELYQQYGDEGIIRDFYPSMKKWMDAMDHVGFPGTPWEFGLGDWLAPVETDNHLIWNAFHYRNCVYMARFAEILGSGEDAREYCQKAEEAKEFWNAHFINEKGMTCNANGDPCDTQASYAISLSCGVVAEEKRRSFADALARKTKECGCRVQTGFFGTGPLNPMLCEGGYPELALALIQQTGYPSWLYPVTQGATTVWERWDSYTLEKGFGGQNAMNSFNHYSLGSVVSWLYEYVLGIQRDEEAPGYQHFTLHPLIQGFNRASGQIETPFGVVESGWAITGNTLEYRCAIPANAEATLILNGNTRHLSSGKYIFTEKVV